VLPLKDENSRICSARLNTVREWMSVDLSYRVVSLKFPLIVF